MIATMAPHSARHTIIQRTIVIPSLPSALYRQVPGSAIAQWVSAAGVRRGGKGPGSHFHTFEGMSILLRKTKGPLPVKEAALLMNGTQGSRMVEMGGIEPPSRKVG